MVSRIPSNQANEYVLTGLKFLHGNGVVRRLSVFAELRTEGFLAFIFPATQCALHVVDFAELYNKDALLLERAIGVLLGNFVRRYETADATIEEVFLEHGFELVNIVIFLPVFDQDMLLWFFEGLLLELDTHDQ